MGDLSVRNMRGKKRICGVWIMIELLVCECFLYKEIDKELKLNLVKIYMDV